MAQEKALSTLRQLVDSLKEIIASGIVQNQRVEDALLRVDRAIYCPLSERPYADSPYTIGYAATISAPHMHAYALEALKDKLIDGAKVLDVGAGSGYLTSCLAHLVGSQGRVFGVEHVKELVKQADLNIRKDCPDLLDKGRVRLLVADGRLGLPDFAPYDAIHVGATTTSDVAQKLIEQLKPGGRIVLPIMRGENQMFESIDKLPNGEIEYKTLLRVRYVPLTDLDSQLQNKD